MFAFKSLTIAIITLLLCACSNKHGEAQGYLEGEFIYLANNYSGILQQLPVSRGDTVKRGQLLYVLDKEPQASQLEQAKQQWLQQEKLLEDLEKGQRNTVLESIEAQRNQAAANLKFSTATVQRYRILYAKGAIDKQSLDQAESNFQRDAQSVNEYASNLAEAKLGGRDNQIKAQLAAVEAARAAMDKAQWELQQKTAYAPADGYIYDTYYKVGEFINAQQPVLSLLAPVDIKLIFYIPEPKRSNLAIGEKIYFKCDGCSGKQPATINYISYQAEYTPPVIFSRESRMKLVYRVEAKLPLEVAKHFYPGQPVDVYY